MKSIIEEASTISKAVEQAWLRADKPQEFKVKVFEEPKHNMFGMTTKSAKIGLFFDAPMGIPQRYTSQSPASQSPASQSPASQRVASQRVVSQKKEPIRKPVPTQNPVDQAPMTTPAKPKKAYPTWTDEMATFSKDWVKECLNQIGIPNVEFTTQIAGNSLKVQFETTITGNETQDRLVFSSFAYLILASLRSKYSQPFPRLKVVLKVK